jgi:hypothetical protein
MGCNESREKEIISSSSISFTKTPLPLHIYPHFNNINNYSLQISPNSSPTSSSPGTSPKASPTAFSPKASPTAFSPKASLPTYAATVAPIHLTRLNSIAHFKFSMFDTFPKHVQHEILHHIDKELNKQ